MANPATKEEARLQGEFEAAQELLRLGMDMSKPVDIFSVIERSNLWLTFVPLDRVLGVFLAEASAGIFINNRRPQSVQRLTAAHEYGHFCLQHKASFDDEEAIFGSSTTDLREIAAQAFALNFVMSYPLVENLWSTLSLPLRANVGPEDVYALSLAVGVSYRAAVVQLSTLGMLGRRRAQEFLGWQPKEIKRKIAGGVGPEDPWADIWLLAESDSGRQLSVRERDEIIVRLDEYASTGFSWERVGGDETVVRAMDDSFIAPDEEDDEAGAPGQRCISYRATSPGRTDILIELRQPWNPVVSADRFEVEVEVNGMPTGLEPSGLRPGIRQGLLEVGAGR